MSIQRLKFTANFNITVLVGKLQATSLLSCVNLNSLSFRNFLSSVLSLTAFYLTLPFLNSTSTRDVFTTFTPYDYNINVFIYANLRSSRRVLYIFFFIYAIAILLLKKYINQYINRFSNFIIFNYLLPHLL